MMPNRRGFFSKSCLGLVLSAALLVPRPAAAYCRTMGCSTTRPELACTADARGCLINNLPLFWPTSCISFGVQKDGSRSDGISFETMNSVVETAFTTWISADCGGAQPKIDIENAGAINCDQLEYNKKGPNAHVFRFRDDDWPHENSLDALALTTISFDPETGQIYDVDVEVNSFEAKLTTSDTNPMDDLQSIITHEVGHFFGLSHSDVEEATMFKSYRTTDIGLRTLAADDIAGMCAIYDPDRELPPHNCEARHGFSPDCGEAVDGGCCAIHATQPKNAGSLATLLAGVGLIVWRRRRSRGSR